MHFAILRALVPLAVSFVCSSTLLAQNDECAGALPLADGLNGPYSNVSATANLADPTFTCGGAAPTQKDLWFTYLAPISGAATIETCSNAGFDTRIAIYTGSCGALFPVTCNDDACSLQSRASFAGIAGTTYTVRVAGFSALSGTFSLQVSTVLSDECATAATVVAGETGPFSNVGATSSAEPWSCGTPGNDLWFRFVSGCALPVLTVSTCNSSFDTVLEVYSGTCAALTPVGCNDDSCGLQSSVSFASVSGRTYYLRVGGAAGATGSLSIRIDPPCPPSNDACSAPRTISLGNNGPFDSTGATTATPQACGTAANDVWYRYTPSCGAGTYTFDTCGSSYDTVLGVFPTSNSCTLATSIACNDDACGLQSSVTVTLTSTAAVLLCVGSATGATGLHRVNISTTACAANDECSGATPITLGRNGPFLLGTSTTSSPSSGCNAIGIDSWYRWTAPCNGNAVIGTCGSATATTIAVHRGSSCGTLFGALCPTSCGTSDAQVSFVAAQGESYWVRVYPNLFLGTALDYFLDVTLTGTVGSFSTISTSCGGLSLTPSGTPTLGGALQYTLGGSSGTPYLWFGSVLAPTPFCPPEPCALGADMAVVVAGSAVAGLQVPCDLSLVGGSLACQGADLQIASGSCPAGATFAIAFSDTVVTTIL